MDQIPAVPEGVLLQSILVDAHGGESGYRIYADGRYESRPRGRPWTPGRVLTGEQVSAVRAAIASAGIERLQPRYAPPAGADDPSTLWFQVVDGGAVRSVAVEAPFTVPEIEALAARLVAIFKTSAPQSDR